MEQEDYSLMFPSINQSFKFGSSTSIGNLLDWHSAQRAGSISILTPSTQPKRAIKKMLIGSGPYDPISVLYLKPWHKQS